MKEKKRYRRKECIRTLNFLKWVYDYPVWWRAICTPGDKKMDSQTMKQLIEELERESFYEIIFVLLMVHRNEEYVEGLAESMLMQLLISKWEAGDKEDIIEALMNYWG